MVNARQVKSVDKDFHVSFLLLLYDFICSVAQP